MSERIHAALGELERIAAAPVEPDDELPRFAAELPEPSAELRDRVLRLSPWRDGPFWLGGDLVAGAGIDFDRRLPVAAMAMAGKRVAVAGPGLFAAFAYAGGGANVVAGALGDALEQARVLQEVYGSELELREGGWERLDGRYDLIHCDGLVGSEPHPARLLEHLAGLLEPGGTLLLRCPVLADPALSQYADVLPATGRWWVPGRLTRRWMLEVAGLTEREVLVREPQQGDVRFETVAARKA